MTRREAVHVAKDGSVEVKVTGKMAKLMAGEISVEDMDDEELFRMQFRDKRGNFPARTNKVVPREIAMTMQRELMKRGMDKLSGNLLKVVDRLLWLAYNAEDEAVQLRAAQYVVDRVLGKTPEKVEISGDAPWQVVLQAITVPVEPPVPAQQNGAKRKARRVPASEATVPGTVERRD